MRRQNVILALLALCLLVVPAGAWQEDFQSGTAYGWTVYIAPNADEYSYVKMVQIPHTDTYAMEISRRVGKTSACANPERQFNYFAFTTLGTYCLYGDYGGRTRISVDLYSESGELVCTLDCTDCFSKYGATYRVEVIRDGSTAYLYRNGGVPLRSAACIGQPYNVRISVDASDEYVYPAYVRIDDVVIGGSEPDILGIIPGDWYVLKHPTDPTMHGLYNSAGQYVYTHIMHATYGLDDPADENTRIVLQRMGSGYFLNTTYLPVGTYHGVVEI
ncbi:MAG TPA: hypothetical protein PKH75_15230, partial [Bacillota bacterium]|nr:hypothetical protein [Bacillota bacterium]